MRIWFDEGTHLARLICGLQQRSKTQKKVSIVVSVILQPSLVIILPSWLPVCCFGLAFTHCWATNGIEFYTDTDVVQQTKFSFGGGGRGVTRGKQCSTWVTESRQGQIIC